MSTTSCFACFVVAALLGELLCAQTLIVIRHGQSVSNVNSINSANPAQSVKYPLTQLGKTQVANAAAKLNAENKELIGNVKWVYVSPLERTRQTADILLDKLGIARDKLVVDYSIMESGFGDNEGKKADHVANKDPEFAQAHFAETDAEIKERVKTFLARAQRIHDKDVLLVVTHGSPMVELVNLAGDEKDRNMNPNNAEFRILKLRQTSDVGRS